MADIRHPLLHFVPSLYEFVAVRLKKPMVLVLNKVSIDSIARPPSLALN